jgi:hypothetical protein
MTTAALDVPVALILFRRADTLRAVFRAVAAARPRRLYLIADGPRPGRPEEETAVAAARAVAERVDWPCAVTRIYADGNMGLRARVESGLDALFAAEERAIVVEDDCVPDASFFPFCAELLERYAADPRVMAVSGDCFQPRPPAPHSYYFSRYPHCWGWATWRRAWALYDGPMADWPALRDGPWLRELLGDRRAAAGWRATFDRVYAGEVDSWAYRWTYSCWRRGGLTALPAVNLVSNIGFGGAASNTGSTTSPFAALPARALAFPLRHPPTVAPDTRADGRTERTLFSRGLWTRLGWRARRLLGRAHPRART